MKLREPRRKVLIGARMRSGSAWDGVKLLNLSSRGAMAQARTSPPKGSYIEIRRGAHVIVARVMWTEQNRFGIRSQDPIGVDALIAEPDASAKPVAATAPTDRRALIRKAPPSERHGQSRIFARYIEYCCLVGSAGMLSILGVSVVKDALATPLSKVGAALAHP